MLRAILFDADDTLYEEKHAKVAAETAVAEEVARMIGMDVASTYRRFMAAKKHVLTSQKGDPGRNERLRWIRTLLKEVGAPLSEAERLSLLYWDRAVAEIRPYADAAIVLPQLVQHYSLFVLSNEDIPHTKRKLEQAGFLRHFRAIVSAFEIGAEKPEKKFFDAALAHAGITAADAIMVGNDPRSDVQGANSNGIDSVLLRRGPFARYAFKTPEETPKYIINDYFELQDLLVSSVTS